MATKRNAASTPNISDDLSAPSEVPVVVVREAPKGPRIPTILTFPLVVVMASSLLVLANTALVELTGPKLYPVSRNLREDWQIAVVTGWKVLELGIGWFAGFDGLDMLSFTLLTHIPHAYLLRTFYLVERAPTIVFLLSEAVASSIPFHLLRRRNAHHRSKNASSTSASTDVPPQASDLPTSALIAAVSASMYALPVVLSLVTWLPLHLASNFYGLKTLDPAHNATLGLVIATLLPLGVLAADFLFNATASYSPTIPVVASTEGFANQNGTGHKEKTILEFDPETATLYQTLHRNVFWHAYLPARTQELLSRAITLVVWTLANTAFLAVAEVEGTDLVGAIGWGSVWAVGAAAASGMLGWIAGVTV